MDRIDILESCWMNSILLNRCESKIWRIEADQSSKSATFVSTLPPHQSINVSVRPLDWGLFSFPDQHPFSVLRTPSDSPFAWRDSEIDLISHPPSTLFVFAADGLYSSSHSLIFDLPFPCLTFRNNTASCV